MHKGRITVAIMAGIGMFASFLPWRSVNIDTSEYGFNFNFANFKQLGVDTWLGYVNIALFLVIIIMALVGSKEKMIAKGFPKMTILVVSGLALLFTAFVLVAYALSTHDTALVGVYLALFGSILTAATPFFFNEDGTVDMPSVKEVIDDIEESADIVEDKVEDIADKVEDKIEDKLGLDDDDKKDKSEDKKEN